MGYEYDIFLSYRRKRPISDWVVNHFYPELSDWLATSLPYDPKIYLDQQQDVGVAWPQNVKRALLRSRCLVTVWAPQYFRSEWCMAEWQSMLRREQVLNMKSPDNPMGLVYPVVFHDGEWFPEEAQNTQHKCLKKWNCPHPVLKQSPDYIEFVSTVQEIADDLATMISQAPIWDQDWPVVLPAPTPPVRFTVPKI